MDYAAILIAVATVITSLATLVTAVRTHKGIRTQNGQTVGAVVDQIAQRSALNVPPDQRTPAEQATATQTPPEVV